jgi:AcrR family transcriptional regulator
MARKNNSDQRRVEILAQVYDIIARDGIEGVTFSKIAQHIGIHKSLLSYYFKNKEEMIIAVVDFMADSYEKGFYDMVSRIDDPKKRFEGCLDILLGEEWDRIVNPTVFYSCYYLSLLNERIRNRYRMMYDRVKEVIVKELKSSTEQGVLRIEDPEKAAVLIISIMEGFDYYWTIVGLENIPKDYGRYLKGQIMRLFGGREE